MKTLVLALMMALAVHTAARPTLSFVAPRVTLTRDAN